MSFQTFQELPSHNLQIPEFRPMPVPQLPVFNTSETIAPLLHLAQYLSPEARALRKAAVAKANIEWRAYNGDARALGILHPMWYPELRAKRQEARARDLENQIRQKRLEQMSRDPMSPLMKQINSGYSALGLIPTSSHNNPDPASATSTSSDTPSDESSPGDFIPVEPDNLTP